MHPKGMTQPNIAPQLLPLATPIDELHSLAGNPRRGNVDAVAKSYARFGQQKPIVVRIEKDEDGTERKVVLAGNHQLAAARKLGWEEIAAVVVEYDDKTAKAFALADNRVGELGSYDIEALQEMIADIQDDPELLAATAWTHEDLSLLVGGDMGTHGKKDADDNVPDVPVIPITQLGDVWEMGQHRMVCGDCTDPEVMKTLMGKHKAELLFTDPPWNVAYGTSKHPTYKKRAILNDDMTDEKWAEFVQGFCKAFKDNTKPGAPAYIVMSPQEWPSLDKGMRDAGFHWSSTIIWVKDQLVLSRKDYHTQYEPIWNGHNGPMDPIWYGWNEDAARLAKLIDRTQSDVWLHERPKRSEMHPTTKPVELVKRAIINSSRPGAIVLDCFGGSGSTLMAAAASGRVARLTELDPKYCDVIAKRYQEWSGETPRRNGEDCNMLEDSEEEQNG
jgi:DNA modification methylase